MTSERDKRVAQLSAALEIYLECVELGEPRAIESKLADNPELRVLVLAMLGQRRSGRRQPLGRRQSPADDAPPA